MSYGFAQSRLRDGYQALTDEKQSIQQEIENQTFLEQARHHAWFHHHNADGWITIAKKVDGHFKQYHYKAQDLAVELSGWLGEDVYFSQNTFYKPQRRLSAYIMGVACLLVVY